MNVDDAPLVLPIDQTEQKGYMCTTTDSVSKPQRKHEPKVSRQLHNEHNPNQSLLDFRNDEVLNSICAEKYVRDNHTCRDTCDGRITSDPVKYSDDAVSITQKKHFNLYNHKSAVRFSERLMKLNLASICSIVIKLETSILDFLSFTYSYFFLRLG